MLAPRFDPQVFPFCPFLLLHTRLPPSPPHLPFKPPRQYYHPQEEKKAHSSQARMWRPRYQYTPHITNIMIGDNSTRQQQYSNTHDYLYEESSSAPILQLTSIWTRYFALFSGSLRLVSLKLSYQSSIHPGKRNQASIVNGCGDHMSNTHHASPNLIIGHTSVRQYYINLYDERRPKASDIWMLLTRLALLRPISSSNPLHPPHQQSGSQTTQINTSIAREVPTTFPIHLRRIGHAYARQQQIFS